MIEMLDRLNPANNLEYVHNFFQTGKTSEMYHFVFTFSYKVHTISQYFYANMIRKLSKYLPQYPLQHSNYHIRKRLACRKNKS